VKILLGDFNEKLRTEDTFKPTKGRATLHEIINDNLLRLVEFWHIKE
jgi:hypothetical protein